MKLIVDELTSIVLDVGHGYTRAGYSGEETPKVVFPSYVGRTDRNFVGDTQIHFRRDGMNVMSPFDGENVDWDALESIWEYALVDRMKADLANIPVLLIESSFETKSNREKMTELLFEKFKVPAGYLAKNSVTASFAAGKSTSLVLDCGASSISAVPVYDGFTLNTTAVRQRTGGDFLTEQTSLFLENELNVKVRFQAEVEAKKAVGLGEPSDFVSRKLKITDSFRTFAKFRAVQDFKESVCQVSDMPFNEKELSARPPKYYEFADGFNSNFGVDRFRVGEILFNPSLFAMKDPNQMEDSELLSVQEIVHNCISKCDVDVRANLFNNIVLTGGASLLPGFSERLYSELCRISPSSKIRIHSSSVPIERKFGSWIGGSILGSLGSFQQLWLTKDEYEEKGAAHMITKCQ